jgi:hypothetical protein
VLVVVGIGVKSENDKVRYWLRNSHGVKWGDGGYGKFSQKIMFGRLSLINGGVAPAIIWWLIFFFSNKVSISSLFQLTRCNPLAMLLNIDST